MGQIQGNHKYFKKSTYFDIFKKSAHITLFLKILSLLQISFW